MKIEEMIKAWKDPEFRAKSGASIEHPAGPSEVSDETLRTLGGGGTINWWTTSIDCYPSYVQCTGSICDNTQNITACNPH